MNKTETTIDNFTKELMEFQRMVNTSTTKDARVSELTVRRYNGYSDKDVQRFLQNPRAHERELRQVSRYLENTSQIYKRIVSYLPSIALDCPVVIPTKIDQLKKETVAKQYNKAIKYLNTLSLPHELVKVRNTCFREDVFYGIEFETEQSYYIKQLNPDYCRICSNDMGVYNFEFDLTFFYIDSTFDCDTTLLEVYDSIIPNFFKSAFLEFKNSGWTKRWVELPSDKSICIKLHEDLEYNFPPYASVYSDIDDICDYKALSKIAEEQNNYKMIGFKIPLQSTNKSEKPDHFAIKMSTAKMFYEMARANVDKNVGIYMTPFEAEPISFNSGKTNSQNRVQDATTQLFNSLGVSQMLFNADSTTALKYSIATDEAIVFKLNRQIERWITRKFYKKFNGAFKVALLDATVFNKNDLIDQLLKLAQYGIPTTAQISALVGMNQADLMSMNFVENDILDIANTFIPLSSSHTQASDTSDSEGGRPQVKDEDLSESGQATRENGGNIAKQTKYQQFNGDVL